MYEALRVVLDPGSIETMMAVFVFGVILLYAKPRWGRLWLTVVVLGYWVLTTPLGAGLLARSLDSGYAPLGSAEEARGATAVVMLGGGSLNVRAGGRGLSYVNRGSGLRVLETARVYHMLPHPLVIVSGGVTDKTPGAAPESDAFVTAVMALGVPAERVVTESESHNTHEEAVALKRILDERHISRFVLVTSPLHMSRSLATFAVQGLFPIPSPAPLYADRGPEPFLLMPNEASFEVSDGAVYEWLARSFYWLRGWTRRSEVAE